MYKGFAAVYDQLMGDIPYDQFAQVFYEAIEFTGRAPHRVIDLGCGTGAMFPWLLKRARLVLGVDPSEEMLAIAGQRAQHTGQRLQLFQGLASSFRVPAKADWCVAFCDVLNYVRNAVELVESFRNVRKNLIPEGWILFDLHSPYKIHQVIGENVYYDASEDVVALMKTTVEQEEHLLTYELLLFQKEVDGRYRKEEEIHRQRAFSLNEVIESLAAAGFKKVYVRADFQGNWQDVGEFCRMEGEAGLHTNKPQGVNRFVCSNQKAFDSAERWFFLVS